MGLLSRKRAAEALPDLGAYSEDQWAEARRRHAWRTMTRDLRARYAAEREQRLARLEDPDERERVERYYAALERPLLADDPPESWLDEPEAVRPSVIERPLGLRFVTPADLRRREIEERARLAEVRYTVLEPGNGRPRPPGYGPDERVYVPVEDARMSDERIDQLEARLAELEQWRGNLERREQTRGQIMAALGQPGGVPPADHTRRSVDPRELGVSAVPGAD